MRNKYFGSTLFPSFSVEGKSCRDGHQTLRANEFLSREDMSAQLPPTLDRVSFQSKVTHTSPRAFQMLYAALHIQLRAFSAAACCQRTVNTKQDLNFNGIAFWNFNYGTRKKPEFTYLVGSFSVELNCCTCKCTTE